MSYGKNIDGNLDHIDVVGETALVRGTLQSARVGDNGILHLQGAGLQGTFEVEPGGTLRIDGGLLGGRIVIHEEGRAVLHGPYTGSVQNDGVLILHPQGPIDDLQVRGSGRVIPWEQLPDDSKQRLAGAELTWSVDRR